MKKKFLWIAACASSIAVSLAIMLAQKTISVGPDWSATRLHVALGEHGVTYDAWTAPEGGLLLKTSDDPTPWKELWLLANESPREFSSKTGRLLISFNLLKAGPSEVREEDVVYVQRLILRGHPEELKRVLSVITP